MNSPQTISLSSHIQTANEGSRAGNSPTEISKEEMRACEELMESKYRKKASIISNSFIDLNRSLISEFEQFISKKLKKSVELDQHDQEMQDVRNDRKLVEKFINLKPDGLNCMNTGQKMEDEPLIGHQKKDEDFEKEKKSNMSICMDIFIEYLLEKSKLNDMNSLTQDVSSSGQGSDESTAKYIRIANKPKEELESNIYKGLKEDVCTRTFKVSDIFRDLNHSELNMRYNQTKFRKGKGQSAFSKKPSKNAEMNKRSKATISEKEENPMPEHEALDDDLYQDLVKVENTVSKVLYIKGADPEKVSIRELCNLFSNYGNLEIGFLQTGKQFALVKYSSLEGASLGMNYLNRIQLHEKKLSIFYSHFNDIEETKYINKKEFFVPEASCRRYKSGVPAQANPVSRTLHVCVFFNHKRRFVKDFEILDLIERISKPIRVQRDSNKDNVNMWFMEFSDIQSALDALMKCHDEQFEDGNLRISFTKTRRTHNMPCNSAVIKRM